MRRYTDEEYDTLPHVIMTSDQEWDPTVLDDYDINVEDIAKQLSEQWDLLPSADYDNKGQYLHHLLINGSATFNENIQVQNIEHTITIEDDIKIDPPPITADKALDCPTFDFWIDNEEYNHLERVNRCVKSAARQDSDLMIYDTNFDSPHTPRIHTPAKQDYKSLKPYFSWLPTHRIEATFRNSTQYGYMSSSPEGNLFKRWKAPNPAMNVFRLQDDVLTDMVYSDTEAIYGGHTEAQIFFGRKSHIIHVEPISEKHPFIKCFQNFVRKFGAPLRLLGDHAGNQASNKVMDYLRMLWIGFWCSEAYYQHQNMFERRYQTFKRLINRLMDRTGTPPELWFLCLCHVAYVLNYTSDPTLNDRQPIFVATGEVGDISALLPFHWMQPVYYRAHDSPFPSTTTEHLGYWVGIAENVGHSMTFKIWNKATGHILDRSSIRPADDPNTQNLRANANHDNALHPDVGNRVAKFFDNDLFFGTIHKQWQLNGQPLWRVKFDDGDDEDYSESQYNTARELYKQHQDQDLSFPTHAPTPVTLPGQNYGEHISEHPPDAIYSVDCNGNLETNEFAEAIYLSEDAKMDDYLRMEDSNLEDINDIQVVLTDENGHSKLDNQGNPILIKGLDHATLQGITFLKQEEDGTINRVRVIDALEDRRQRNKDFTKFRIRYDKDEVEDIMSSSTVV